MARRKGRKALPAAERRSRHLHMYLTPPEYAVVRQFRKRNESGSDFLRRLVLPLVDTLVAEREAAKAAGAATATAENPTPVSPRKWATRGPRRQGQGCARGLPGAGHLGTGGTDDRRGEPGAGADGGARIAGHGTLGAGVLVSPQRAGSRIAWPLSTDYLHRIMCECGVSGTAGIPQIQPPHCEAKCGGENPKCTDTAGSPSRRLWFSLCSRYRKKRISPLRGKRGARTWCPGECRLSLPPARVHTAESRLPRRPRRRMRCLIVPGGKSGMRKLPSPR